MYADVDTAVVVPVNLLALTDDTDFKTREVAIAYDQAGMDLVWNFMTPGGVTTQTAVIPTTGGVYDWAHTGDGMYTIEIPASGGGSINNDLEGFGWFTGICTGVLHWRSPMICFRPAGTNDLLIENAFSATRGLTGTALPAVAADAAGGVPISDAGGLDIDAKLANTNEVTAARMAALTDWVNGGRLDLILDIIAADVVNIDGAAMRGTNNAALASVLGALSDAAAAGDPTASDTLIQYIKQLINVLVGTTGITTFPAEAAPGNNVSLAEIIRAIHTDVTGLNGDAMRGTNNSNTTVPDAAGIVPTAVEIRQEMDSNSVDLDQIQTDIAALNNLAASDILTQVNAALDAAISELGVAVPAATPSLRTGLMLIYMALRNKTITQTSGTDALEIHNSAGTKITSKLLTDDGSDYTEAKMT